MAISGAWKEQREIQAGARIWGSGWHPIHAVPDSYGGRNIAPDPNMATSERDYEIVDLNAPYTTYEVDPPSDSIWGYGRETGTADRPRLGENHYDTSGGNESGSVYPPYDVNGDSVRSVDRGAEITEITKLNPQDEAFNGWDNKLTTGITNAKPSAVEQYEMQTSMTQRDKVRGMSQTTGRASLYSAAISSRIIGEKLKSLIGSPERLFDMFPRQQAYMVRPFYDRAAGTDDPRKMRVNDMYVSEPVQRVPPGDPYQGATLENDNAGYYDEQWTVGYD